MADKINAREWWLLNREKVSQISTFWLLPAKWRRVLSQIVYILDVVFVEHNHPFSIQVDEKG